MARLLVKLHGEEVTRLDLQSGTEYIAGRAPDAHIRMDKLRGISRHHLKFYERDGQWVCESLSKFSLLQKGGASVEVIELGEPCLFAIPPYEFHFDPTPEKAEAVVAAPEASEEKLPTFYQPRTKPPISEPLEMENTSPGANSEATVAGAAHLVAYVRISYPNTADDAVLKLEGHLWTAGRDPDCEIPIESPNASRKHFELARTNEGFFITDLGSSNGTKINGQRIPPHEPTRVESGDELAIKNVTLGFEIRDNQFKHRVDALPAAAFNPLAPVPLDSWNAQQAPTEAYGRKARLALSGKISGRWQKVKEAGTKKLIVRGTIVILCGIGIALALQPNNPPAKPTPSDRSPNGAAGNVSVSFENLTNEQRSVVKDSFNLARNLYVQGKYELCLTELAKVHDLIAQYENSKELQSFCEQGRELVHRQMDLYRKEQERAVIEQQIAGYVDGCKGKLPEDASVDETRQCLTEAMELDPEHHLIIEMIHNAQMREEEKKLMVRQKKDEDARYRKGLAHLNKARQTYKAGNLAKAVAEYERFINTSYPHSESMKAEATRDVASIKEELKGKVATLVEQCKSLGGKSSFKEAYLACSKAYSEDPSNEDAKHLGEQMLSELKHELKGVYEDSVLEESLGNVDSAKEKWKKLLKDDVENGEYAKKAHDKLQKYGIGL